MDCFKIFGTNYPHFDWFQECHKESDWKELVGEGHFRNWHSRMFLQFPGAVLSTTRAKLVYCKDEGKVNKSFVLGMTFGAALY